MLVVDRGAIWRGAGGKARVPAEDGRELCELRGALPPPTLLLMFFLIATPFVAPAASVDIDRAVLGPFEALLPPPLLLLLLLLLLMSDIVLFPAGSLTNSAAAILAAGIIDTPSSTCSTGSNETNTWR